DEPAAALGVSESGQVLELIQGLRTQALGVVVISHNLQHVFAIADRIQVMRGGRCVGIRRRQETTGEEIVRMITGADELVAGAVDLSVGSMYAACSIVFGFLVATAKLPIPTALVLTIALGALVGLVNGALATKLGIPSLIVTLGMMSTMRGATLFGSSGWPIP